MKIKNVRILVALLVFSTAPLLAKEAASPALSKDSFGIDLYRSFSKEPGNIFFSPYSVEVALTMTSAGAEGNTLKEMETVLKLKPKAHESARALQEELDKVSSQKNAPILKVANRLWGQAGEEFLPTFTESLKTNYGSDLERLNFRSETEKSRGVINSWVEKKTEAKIKNLLPVGSINPQTMLVLTNAIYFKGLWEKAFKKEATKPAAFTPSSGEKYSIPFMHAEERAPYFEDKDLQALRLAYKGDSIALTILLPQAGSNLKALEKKLSLQLLENVRGGFNRQLVNIAMPKFRLEFQKMLNPELKSLGMRDAFSPAAANFNGMQKQTGVDLLHITAVIHKAFVELDEAGTEAAAATAVVVGIESAAIDTPKEFKADRPFLFFIEHLPTKTILFFGRVEKP